MGQYGSGSSYTECTRQRRYTKAKQIETLAISKYKQNGRGISFKDLLANGLAKHKQQAQTTIKHSRRTNILFTPYNRKPQQYYATCLKSEILNKIIPAGATGVGLSKHNLLRDKALGNSHIDSDFYQGLAPIFLQALESYVLPLLPQVPLYIHKMQLKLRIPREYYHEIALPVCPWNKGKEHEEIIGNAHAKYRFYANGTVVISTESTNNPFRLENESDLSCLMAFFGQVRDRIVVFLADRHERILPSLMDWEITQCDINKDIIISDWLLVTGLKIQIKHYDHLFRVYFKSMCKNTVCRVEESCNPRKPVIQAINDILNPNERIERRLDRIEQAIKGLRGAVLFGEARTEETAELR
jgi:hypothetical protein